MRRGMLIKLGVAALIAGAVAGGVGVSRAQVANVTEDPSVTTTTITPAPAATAAVANPNQTG